MIVVGVTPAAGAGIMSGMIPHLHISLSEADLTWQVHGVRFSSISPCVSIHILDSYHSFDDKRIPLAFTCFRCRVRKDKNYAMIAVNDLLPNMMSKFDDLALFRYVIALLKLLSIKALNLNPSIQEVDKDCRRE